MVDCSQVIPDTHTVGARAIWSSGDRRGTVSGGGGGQTAASYTHTQSTVFHNTVCPTLVSHALIYIYTRC